MTERRIALDGAPHDGVGHDFVTPDHLARYRQAAESLSRLQSPILIHAANPHEKLIFVGFDGTGNNKFTKPDFATNIAKFDDQLEAFYAGGTQIHPIYIVGPGTQRDRIAALLDSARGSTYESNIQEAYGEVVRQANTWVQRDPDAVIRVHSTGFSRGASQAAGFTRLLHDEGIPDLRSEAVQPDGTVRYERFLIEPGKIVQTVGLMDPVATGTPMQFDRRLPPSVVSGFQITAGDEFRKSFPSDQIIPPGLSEDGRFLNVMLPGAHSDVGGGYLRNGLSIRCGNLMRDYCNSLSDVPYLSKEYEPTDPRLNVIHKSTEGELIFRVDLRTGLRGHPSGTNETLAPPGLTHAGPAPHKPEPVDPLLMNGMPRRAVPIGPANEIPAGPALPPTTEDALFKTSLSSPFARKLVHQLNVVSTAIEGYQALDSLQSAQKAGNEAGSDSVALHFVSRNAGGLAGAHAFMALGAAAGVETGPGIVVTGGIGTLVGAVAGDKIADEYDLYRINHQKDAQGMTWRRDEHEAWVRDIPPLPATPHGERIVAPPDVSARLSYQAASTEVEIALATEYEPKDPFAQPAAPGETRSAKDAPWVRDIETHQWTRDVVDRYLEHGVVSSHRETASPSRAAELDDLAEKTIRQNGAESPLGVAQRYAEKYEDQGWGAHGPLPSAVTHALNAPQDKVLASDGHKWARGAEGEWERPGRVFGTNHPSEQLREELDGAERILGRMSHPTESVAAPSMPEAPRIPSRLDDPVHPDHEFFKQVRGHVVELDKGMGRSPDQYTDNIASALTVQARADGMKRVDAIELSDDRSNLWAVEIPPGLNGYLFELATKVPTAEADTPMEQSGARWPEAMQQFQGHEQERVESQQRAQERSQAEAQSNSMRGPSMSM